jgi:pyruvate/2-oxoglutarate dehydrogenase complex dihydrolipoamide acyltransferase (E2) component
MFDVRMPQLGETVTEGTITRWFKKPGDVVAVDEPLFEVSTDKVDTEVPAPAAGVLTSVMVAEGETVAVGSVVCSLAAAGEFARTQVAPSEATIPQVVQWADERRAVTADVVVDQPAGSLDQSFPAPAGPPAVGGPGAGWKLVAPEPVLAVPVVEPTVVQVQPEPKRPTTVVPPVADTHLDGPLGAAVAAGADVSFEAALGAARPSQQALMLSPVVRALIADHGIDPAAIAGTGSAGRITRQDVMAYIDATVRGTASACADIDMSHVDERSQTARTVDVKTEHEVTAVTSTVSGGVVQPAWTVSREHVPAPVATSGTGPVPVSFESAREQVESVLIQPATVRLEDAVSAGGMVAPVRLAPVEQVAAVACAAQIDVDFTAVVEGFAAAFPATQDAKSAAVVFAICEALTRYPHHHVGRFASGRPVVDVVVERFASSLSAGSVSSVMSAESKLVRALIKELAASTAGPCTQEPGMVKLVSTGSAVVFPADAAALTFCVGDVRRTLVVDDTSGVAVRFVGRMSVTVSQRPAAATAAVELLTAVRDVLESRRWAAEPV